MQELTCSGMKDCLLLHSSGSKFFNIDSDIGKGDERNYSNAEKLSNVLFVSPLKTLKLQREPSFCINSSSEIFEEY